MLPDEGDQWKVAVWREKVETVVKTAVGRGDVERLAWEGGRARVAAEHEVLTLDAWA